MTASTNGDTPCVVMPTWGTGGRQGCRERCRCTIASRRGKDAVGHGDADALLQPEHGAAPHSRRAQPDMVPPSAHATAATL